MVTWLMVVICLTASPAKAPTAAAVSHPKVVPAPLVSPALMAAWTRVAQCETHQQWHRFGPWHDGGLGMLRASWVHYGGLQFSPWPHQATPEQQVLIATRINAGYAIPDQDGQCRAW